MQRLALGALAWVIVALVPRIAMAQPRARLDATSDVCDPAPLRSRVTELLADRAVLADGDDVDVSIRFAARRDGDGVVGTIEIVDPGGGVRRRTLVAADCDALAEAAAFAIALVLTQPVAAPAPEADPVPPADPPPLQPADPEPVQAKRVVPVAEAAPLVVEQHASSPMPRVTGLESYAGVLGGLAGGDTQAGVAVGLALRRGRLSGGVDFALTAPERVDIGPGRVVVTTRVFELAGCIRRGGLAGCGTLAVGWVRGRGEDLVDPAVATTPYAAAGVRLVWDAAISSRIAARVQVATRIPMTRNRFLVDDMAVWSTSRVEGWLGVGIVARIP